MQIHNNNFIENLLKTLGYTDGAWYNVLMYMMNEKTSLILKHKIAV